MGSTEETRHSRRLILDAATAEFAAVGLAGGRVDRIAAAAGVNKSQLYYYFGSKDGLFDAALRDNLETFLGGVALTAHDLPGYAARLYDSYLEHPELLRLATWHRLERVPKGELFAGLGIGDDEKLAAISEAQGEGRVDPSLSPSEVLSLVTAIAMTWSPVNVTYAASIGDAESEHERRRSVVREAVSRALAPGGRGNGAGAGSPEK